MYFIEDMQSYSDTDSDSDSEDVSALAVKKLKFHESCEEYRLRTRYKIPAHAKVPLPGMMVDRKQFRKAGPYTIGAEVKGYRPVGNIFQYIGKKENTNKFYQLKILQLSATSAAEGEHSQDEQRGKVLLHTEYSLLSLLQNEPGVVKHHGIFSDFAYEEKLIRKRKSTYTGSVMKRLILVLDCLIQHPFCDKSASYISLQDYITKMRKLDECEALYILNEIVKIVESIHKKNIVHRDLKLGNIVLNRSSKKVIITNFCLGRYLSNENNLLHDQVGSPAYVSPDVISGKAYKGKPSDMWALGVVYFIMLFGSFPFFNSSCPALLAQIQSGRFHIPDDTGVSKNSIDVIQGLLNLDPEQRLTASQLRPKLETMLAMKKVITPDQCVPFEETKVKCPKSMKHSPSSRSCDQIVPNFQANDEQTVPKPPMPSNGPSLLENMLKNLKNAKRPHSSQQLTPIDSPAQSSRTLATSVYSFIHSLSLSPRSNQSDRSRSIDSMVGEFMVVFNQCFASGRMSTSSNHRLQEFDGILSSSLVTRIYAWLMSEFNNNAFVRHIVLGSNRPIASKVKSFLMHCGVRIDITIFGPQIARLQSASVQQMLTSILNVLGYKSDYFVMPLQNDTTV